MDRARSTGYDAQDTVNRLETAKFTAQVPKKASNQHLNESLWAFFGPFENLSSRKCLN
jgi:hypothetical protein